jgi:hypothetical protein
MPGPVSDAYDPEWGTAANAAEIASRLRTLYAAVSHVLSDRPPVYILDLVRTDLPTLITATFTERDWRLIRFALERAEESL